MSGFAVLFPHDLTSGPEYTTACNQNPNKSGYPEACLICRCSGLEFGGGNADVQHTVHTRTSTDFTSVVVERRNFL